MTSKSTDTTPIRPSGSLSRSSHSTEGIALDGRCPEGTARCLCSNLGELYESGRLKLYRGTVSQTRLEEELRLPRGRLVNRHKQKNAPGRCLSRFDTLLESWGHGTVWTEKTPQIRQYLEELKSAGTLPVNEQGDLNRTAILREFGLENASTHVVQKRAPKLRALLDEYDTTRDDPAYTPYKHDALETRLKELLSRADLKLTHGRIISIEWLAERLGVYPTALNYTPKLNDLIEQKQRAIDRQLRRGRTRQWFPIGRSAYINVGATPYSPEHKRVFDFSELAHTYGLEFAERVGTVFMAVSGRWVSAKKPYHRMRHFLMWLANWQSGDIAERFARGEKVERAEFERAVLRYKAVLTYGGDDGDAHRRPRAPALSVIEKFGDAGLFPRVRIPRAARERKRRSGTPRPSLVEARALDADTTQILETASDQGVEFSKGRDAIAFAKAVATERSKRDDLPSALPAAIMVLCEESLIELRRAASRVFESWREKYEAGRKLIENADATGEEIFKKLEEGRKTGIHNNRWKKLLASIFPKAEPKRALGNLLALIETRFDGICPHGTQNAWGTFWVAQYRKFGGMPEVQEHLVPPHVVVSAIVILYLCESGANSEVALAMRQSAIRKSQTPRHIKVVGRKARAGNKPIYTELAMRSTAEGCTSAAEAMLFYREAVRRARPADRETPLFVHVARGAVRALEEWQLRDDVETIRAESERLALLQIVPTMIRPTVLLVAQMRDPTQPDVPGMLAQHKSPTMTMRYVNRGPFRMILEERIRTFTETIEVVISDEREWKHTGRTERQWKEAFARAQRTGLGIWCADPRAGAQRDFPKGMVCHAVDRCLSCRQMLVIADRESIADIIVWRKALEVAERAGRVERLNRWETTWVPLQAFFHVVLEEKMARGELLVIRRQGEEEAMKRMAQPGFRLPQPW